MDGKIDRYYTKGILGKRIKNFLGRLLLRTDVVVLHPDPDELADGNWGEVIASGFCEVESEDDQFVVAVIMPSSVADLLEDVASPDEIWGARLVSCSDLSEIVLIGDRGRKAVIPLPSFARQVEENVLRVAQPSMSR